jgi:hypothetical protein
MKVLWTSLVAGCLAMSPALANYDANLTSLVTEVLVYSDSNVILFRLAQQPASHPACIPTYFALDSLIPEPRLSRLYARLLSAKSTGEPVNIGYDKTGDCSHSYIRAHRVG